MVDVAGKDVTVREATARGVVRMSPAARRALSGGRLAKGDALAVARIAGIQAAKRTHEWIPLCHPVRLTSVSVDLAPRGRDAVEIQATARAADRTGVEMEALVAVSAAALALYDMVKSMDRGVTIEDVRLLAKSGGRSGTWVSGRRPR
ncbi:MAG: cyclic pyranopterin monophosphate synthase MoaC [Planctomycetales bacterium]|nr:cyclic pyranopterin monophosphate synthase MoaC [Planctomycetales bacterium]